MGIVLFYPKHLPWFLSTITTKKTTNNNNGIDNGIFINPTCQNSENKTYENKYPNTPFFPNNPLLITTFQ